ncbi:hypothetical protein Vretimale_14701 [Volvox reticuliferus]|uniref:Uncharacterized protein n=1 Tax=Volvox reticuliferus TaxID=1737510 RepID=A0A8J4CS90_9CHLO|nr:hypothetical protein Vretifemale_15613 [Volvox reticuliferus]GIM11155.1 hypothetical protein Vretimale_14701 [Volvox reticuliferus]
MMPLRIACSTFSSRCLLWPRLSASCGFSLGVDGAVHQCGAGALHLGVRGMGHLRARRAERAERGRPRFRIRPACSLCASREGLAFGFKAVDMTSTIFQILLMRIASKLASFCSQLPRLFQLWAAGLGCGKHAATSASASA